MVDNSLYKSAINRNLYEIAHALMDYKVLEILEEYNNNKGIYYVGESFFAITHRALFNDMIAHLIKVLDRDKQSATFWYVIGFDKNKITDLNVYSEEKQNFLERLTRRLKIIRNKTHFHIDKEKIFDPKLVWSEADIKGREVREALGYLFQVLGELYKTVFNKSFLYCPEDYTGEDLSTLLGIAKEKQLI